MAIPLSVSRTGVAALAAALLVMVPAWNWRMRYNLLAAGGAMLAVMFVVKPGLLGTVANMFTQANQDPSVSGRTQDYEIVGRLFAERPWFGLGPSTLVPELYQRLVLDNQWLYTLVTLGFVGVVALAALHITCIWLAWLARKRSASEEQKHLCTALIATQVICILVEGTVDAFYYTTYSITMALLMGCCGAVWRFTHPARTVRTSSPRRFLTSEHLHRAPATEAAP
jgi:O-antigen ligase